MKTVAEFRIQYRQVLDAHGEITGPLPAFADDRQAVLAMYRLMSLVRVFDAKAVNLQRTGRLGTYPSCLGHEATHVGVASLSPLDSATILESVSKTGRLVNVHEAARNVGVGAEIAALVAEHALYDLLAPIRRVAGYDTVMPLFKLEQDYIPGTRRIVDAVQSSFADS